MRFLLDEHLPVGLAALITELGHEALHVKTEGWLSASDPDLWRIAQDRRLVMVSKDSDFLALALRDSRPASLLHLNLGNLANRALYEAVRVSWPRVLERLRADDAIVEVRA